MEQSLRAHNKSADAAKELKAQAAENRRKVVEKRFTSEALKTEEYK